MNLEVVERNPFTFILTIILGVIGVLGTPQAVDLMGLTGDPQGLILSLFSMQIAKLIGGIVMALIGALIGLVIDHRNYGGR